MATFSGANHAASLRPAAGRDHEGRGARKGENRGVANRVEWLALLLASCLLTLALGCGSGDGSPSDNSPGGGSGPDGGQPPPPNGSSSGGSGADAAPPPPPFVP